MSKLRRTEIVEKILDDYWIQEEPGYDVDGMASEIARLRASVYTADALIACGAIESLQRIVVDCCDEQSQAASMLTQLKKFLMDEQKI